MKDLSSFHALGAWHQDYSYLTRTGPRRTSPAGLALMMLQKKMEGQFFPLLSDRDLCE